MKLCLVTMGDPSGIGPEIVLKSVLCQDITSIPILVVGSIKLLDKIAKDLRLPITMVPYSRDMLSQSMAGLPQFLPVYDVDNVNIDTYHPGIITEEYGRSSYEYLRVATELAMENPKSCIVTAPIHKEALKLAQIVDPGHTEILKNLTHVPQVMTMFVVENLRVFFYSRHLSLKQAILALDTNRLVEQLGFIHQYLCQVGFIQPHIAVAGLNPHASDGGLFGDEEKKILRPAIEIACKRGWNVSGPVPADSVFYQCLRGKYDVVLSLYHDQGHIACKTYNFEKTVSVTLGLPFLRTSVDHGTAFDIAGQGIANEVSMIEAIKQAKKLCD